MPSQKSLFVDHETLRLARNGVWLSNGHEVTHEEQRRAFARHLGRDDEGWFIRIGADFKRVEVEDTGYFVEGLEGSPGSGFTIRLNDGTSERLAPRTLAYSPDRLICRVHGGRDEARFLSVPYTLLLKNLQEDDRAYFILLEGRRIELAAKPG